ncbi:MAG: GDYXXLXY domain-containing protein [Candidatus Omnitrophota bacterium]|nr:MAG: GDYXXLXY domain-containing protein [Candidatus Omnitrophota bacterium]
MNKSKKTLFLFSVAIVIQIGLLFSFLIKREFHIRRGTKIIVKTVPVDPRSLFRGDYIHLNYEFSRIDLAEVTSSKEHFYRGDKIFVKLTKRGEEWRPVETGASPFKDIASGEVMIRGAVTGHQWLWHGRGERRHKSSVLNVSYGIESYFVPEGEGKYIEDQISQKRVKVELSIDRGGYASVCRIFIDGKEVRFQ